MKLYYKRIILYILLGLVAAFACVFITSALSIGKSVAASCQAAQREDAGDCVDSLLGLLEDENRSYGERNNAIWALGQLGDEQALPVLKKYYIGTPDSKENLDRQISQYELEKAIRLTSGGFNATAIFWR